MLKNIPLKLSDRKDYHYMNKIEVSIVIVCMNNLKNLYPCLNSIRKYTSVSYETLVVAYLFSKENLEKVKKDFPWVTFIESNEIRGFSENNNLALRQAIGEFCFILNDDTYFDKPIVDNLINTFKTLSQEVAILSPITLNKDGSVQRNGKPSYNLFTQLLEYLKLRPIYDRLSKYTNNTGIYQSYNITGAAFLIRKEIFKEVGWFDERYFFCPEDIALSTQLNKKGLKCYVNADVSLVHTGGGTWSKVQTATMPASSKGSLIFFCNNSYIKKIIYLCMAYFFHSIYGFIWLLKNKLTHTPKSAIMFHAHFNTIKTIGTDETPKQIFIKFYSKINAE